MQRWYARLLVLGLAGMLAVTALAREEKEQGWGTIKGQVVWDGEAPKRAQITPDKDKDACLKNGPLFEDKIVVNPKNKGVRWCIVYLVNAKGVDKKIPIHPRLQAIKQKTVTIDQPCCQFEPHALAMRSGQTLQVNNTAGIAHNVHIIGGGEWAGINQLVPAGGQFLVENMPAYWRPYPVKCDIHGWMNGRIGVYNHPYFAITDEDGKFEIKDAPAGDFRLVISHDEGWVIGDKTPDKKGKKITIKADGTTDLGKINMKPPTKD
jgi:plastocyanin